MFACEDCGRTDVATRFGVCWECQQIADRGGAATLPARQVEFEDLASRAGQLLPRIKVVSQTSCSWTSEARD